MTAHPANATIASSIQNLAAIVLLVMNVIGFGLARLRTGFRLGHCGMGSHASSASDDSVRAEAASTS
jgi:hypothetical protein